MKSLKILSVILFTAVAAVPAFSETTPLWPEGKIPDFSENQIAAPREDTLAGGFDRAKHRMPYLEWCESPKEQNRNGTCIIMISGGAYNNTCDRKAFIPLVKKFTEEGYQCVYLWYRTPRPAGAPYYKSAWQDGQRAVRLVRAEAAKRGYSPDRIGVFGCSAGSHLSVLLATSSLTPAYTPVDALDALPCNIAFAIPTCPAYILTDGRGVPNSKMGQSVDVTIDSCFKFDAKTCSMCLFHGANDIYSPNGSTAIYRRLRQMGIPAEIHIDPDRGHGTVDLHKLGRALEYLNQTGFGAKLAPEIPLLKRYASNNARGVHKKEFIWPKNKMPNPQKGQCTPYIEWHFPKVRKTQAIQIIYSGGGYLGNSPDSFEVAPARRYLNEKGMTVVTLKYRTPRPAAPLAKHVTAWQDLQRTIRIVKRDAPKYGLDPNRIGIMGSSAGGHLTLMGCTTSKTNSYWPIDKTDSIACNVAWGIAIYPAYALTDGLDVCNKEGGNGNNVRTAPEFAFDLATPPMLFVHGDSDGWAAMNSVKAWEQLRRMGIQSEIHTLALRKHCFHRNASPGTGSFTVLDRIWDFLSVKKFNR